jgi:hypothetical protein
VFEIWPEKEYHLKLMNRIGSILICLAGGLVLSTISRADDTLPPGNPYGSIVKRNVFALNPIPPPDANPQPDGPPPPKITLTGITTIFGPPEALFKVAGVRRDGKPPQDESYIFREGESQDDVEVTTIDVDKKAVTFNNHGVVQQIPLVAGAASAGTAPTQPAFARPFGRPFMRGGMGGQGGGPGGFQRPFGNGFRPGNNNTYNPNPQSNLSGDDQQALIAAQHAAAIANNNPAAALFPPSPYDGEAQKEIPQPGR